MELPYFSTTNASPTKCLVNIFVFIFSLLPYLSEKETINITVWVFESFDPCPKKKKKNL